MSVTLIFNCFRSTCSLKLMFTIDFERYWLQKDERGQDCALYPLQSAAGDLSTDHLFMMVLDSSELSGSFHTILADLVSRSTV